VTGEQIAFYSTILTTAAAGIGWLVKLVSDRQRGREEARQKAAQAKLDAEQKTIDRQLALIPELQKHMFQMLDELQEQISTKDTHISALQTINSDLRSKADELLGLVAEHLRTIARLKADLEDAQKPRRPRKPREQEGND
jgi:uncharacterized protein HemX